MNEERDLFFFSFLFFFDDGDGGVGCMLRGVYFVGPRLPITD